MNKKPLNIPTIIVLYVVPFFMPITFPIISIYIFWRLNRKRTGWLFAGAEILVFIVSVIVFYIIKGNQEGFSQGYALLLLLGPVSIIHLVSLYLTIALLRRNMVFN
jgi:hypothetical protein